MKHERIAEGQIHIPYNWSYADAAERTADTSVTSDDLGKFARQEDDNSIWMLVATVPTWEGIGGGSAAVDNITAGAALTKTGTTLDVGVDNSTIEVNSDALRVKDAGITVAKLANAAKDTTINVVIDGGGAVITTGIKLDLVVDFACTILGVTMLADQSGSIVVDIWKDTYANYPPTGADSITASAKPTISATTKSQDTTLTGWSTSITAGDTLRFNVDSVGTVTRVALALKVRRA